MSVVCLLWCGDLSSVVGIVMPLSILEVFDQLGPRVGLQPGLVVVSYMLLVVVVWLDVLLELVLQLGVVACSMSRTFALTLLLHVVVVPSLRKLLLVVVALVVLCLVMVLC